MKWPKIAIVGEYLELDEEDHDENNENLGNCEENEALVEENLGFCEEDEGFVDGYLGKNNGNDESVEEIGDSLKKMAIPTMKIIVLTKGMIVPPMTAQALTKKILRPTKWAKDVSCVSQASA